MPAAIVSTTKPRASKAAATSAYSGKPLARRVERGLWSGEEHDKFLEGLKMFPRGPWKKIAGHVGTRSARQVQTHAQKYYEKVGRRLRGLRKDRKKLVRPEHRLDDDMIKLCRLAADKDAPLPLASFLDDPQSPTREIAVALKAQSLKDRTPVKLEPKAAVKAETPVSSPEQAFEEHESFQMMLSGLQIHVHQPICFDYSHAGANSEADANGVDLSDFDDCLDFLIEVLDCPPAMRSGSPCASSSDGSGSDYESSF
jgi:SHAQKYF class myb-like DNA-binding protein